MNFTNKYNLPNELISWIKTDEYDYQQGVISATTLLQPARAYALKKNNYDKLQVDLTNIVSSRIGSVIHDSLAECVAIDEGRGDFKEKRFYVQVSGRKISGKIDLFLNHTVKDYKTTTVYKYLKKDFKDYVRQLSIYRYILVKNGLTVNDFGCIYFLFNDWSKKDLNKDGYPQSKILQQKLQLMSVDDTEKFIIDKLNEFDSALFKLPECTSEQLWQTETTYAVMKNLDAARAIRVFATKHEAEQFNDGKLNVIVERKGVAKRCEYCSVYPICQQCQKMIAENRVANLIKE